MGGVTSFGHASGDGKDGVIALGTEAWNIADGYTKIKILRLLIEIDLLETIAKFGYKDIDDPNYDPQLIPAKRAEAFDRLIFSIKQLIGNCIFSIHKESDKNIIEELSKRINEIEKVKSGIAFQYWNDLTKEDELIINEDHFILCFNILRDIKDELNFPINNAGLIFRHNEEVDLDKIMRDIREGG